KLHGRAAALRSLAARVAAGALLSAAGDPAPAALLCRDAGAAPPPRSEAGPRRPGGVLVCLQHAESGADLAPADAPGLLCSARAAGHARDARGAAPRLGAAVPGAALPPAAGQHPSRMAVAVYPDLPASMAAVARPRGPAADGAPLPAPL